MNKNKLIALVLAAECAYLANDHNHDLTQPRYEIVFSSEHLDYLRGREGKARTRTDSKCLAKISKYLIRLNYELALVFSNERPFRFKIELIDSEAESLIDNDLFQWTYPKVPTLISQEFRDYMNADKGKKGKMVREELEVRWLASLPYGASTFLKSPKPKKDQSEKSLSKKKQKKLAKDSKKNSEVIEQTVQ